MKPAYILAAALAAFAAPALAHMDKGDHDAMMKSKVDKKFAEADTNSDGMISRDEGMAAFEKMWIEEDTNKDGMISKDEKMAYMKKQWEEHKTMKKDMR